MVEIKINYDLEERTKNFAENIIKFVQKVAKNTINLPMVGQLMAAGTSIGANYHEANGASSKKDLKIKFISAKRRLRKLNIG